MNIGDFNTTLSSSKLRENIFKQFGTTVSLKKYTREQLEDMRNKIRTDVFQIENSAGINDLLNNESYQKNKAMLELLNTRIKEMLGEDIKKLKDKLQQLDEAKKGVRAPLKKKHTKTATGSGDGNLANNYPPYDKVTRGDVVAGALGKDQKGGKAKMEESGESCNHTGKEAEKKVKPGKEADQKAKPVKEAEKKPSTWTDKSGETHPATTVKGGKYTGKEAEKKVKPGKEADQKAKPVKESQNAFRQHVRMVNENLTRLINEDEEEKAKAITAASDIANDFTSWMQRVGQYQTKAMIELADEIRHEFGADKAEEFKNVVSPALQTTLSTLMQQREIIGGAVAALAGNPMTPMGAEPSPEMPSDMGPEMPMEPTGPDMMNEPGDEFAASDAAAGAGSTGRELRESAVARKLAESHSIISKLAR